MMTMADKPEHKGQESLYKNPEEFKQRKAKLEDIGKEVKAKLDFIEKATYRERIRHYLQDHGKRARVEGVPLCELVEYCKAYIGEEETRRHVAIMQSQGDLSMREDIVYLHA